MCGIVGKLNFSGQPVDEGLIRRMSAAIEHRGPDDEGVYLSGSVGLGMRRLSIIDLKGGHQPLSNEDGTIWIVYNGEIYNFLVLRDELEARGHRFITSADTEVVVHLYEEMGERCVTRLNGMFAFAIWDARQRRLMLARDRLGKKPLHYAITREGLTFGSEIAALLEDAAIERHVNMLALQQYLRLWYVPTPLTMFEGVMKLPPAYWMVVEDGQIRMERYWDVDFSRKEQFTEQEWQEQIMDLLEDAVRIRMISDVPLGALLSGGVDSSLVVALMSRINSRPVKTFSIGFDNEAYNEIPHSRRVAEYYGTDHYEEIVRPDAAAVLPQLIKHYGEPFGDESCVPTYYVCRMARRHVTVALGGDGGDESFGGYPRLASFATFNPIRSLRGLLATQFHQLRGRSASPDGAPASAPRQEFWQELGYRMREIADPMERYTHQWIVWKDGLRQPLTTAALTETQGKRVLAPLEAAWRRTKGWVPLDRLLYLELMTYLPDDLQVKIDIASMASSLEVRAPLLDYRLVELAARMPADLKFSDGQTKVFLRKLAQPLLPTGIPQRRKWGFSAPIGSWLRHELRPLAEDLLLDASSRKRGIFQPAIVEHLVREHMEGRRDYGRHIWLLLNFELWYRILFAKDSQGGQ